MVAKAYYTVTNPMLRSAKNSIPVLPMSAAGPSFIGMNFWGELSIRQESATFNAVSNSARP